MVQSAAQGGDQGCEEHAGARMGRDVLHPGAGAHHADAQAGAVRLRHHQHEGAGRRPEHFQEHPERVRRARADGPHHRPDEALLRGAGRRARAGPRLWPAGLVVHRRPGQGRRQGRGSWHVRPRKGLPRSGLQDGVPGREGVLCRGPLRARPDQRHDGLHADEAHQAEEQVCLQAGDCQAAIARSQHAQGGGARPDVDGDIHVLRRAQGRRAGCQGGGDGQRE
mmetsp:Transcript_1742/g.4298  ORF Transcript_1742/g.4298 Transcript_1742/m.4298 type:complete len:223 (-) Transcript_1742:204-872(-)